MNELIHTFRCIGLPTEVYSTPDGTSLLLLTHGGRILGLYAPESESNFFWTHPSLKSSELSSSLYKSEGWHNSGGDRTWIAPEMDFFFPDFPRTDNYLVPRALDPGSYRIVKKGKTILLENKLSLMHYPSHRTVRIGITKSISPALNPLRYEKTWVKLTDVKYAGYTQRVSLRISKTTEGNPISIGLWSLLQLPHGGELLIPTHSSSEPQSFFGQIDPSDLTATRNLIRYRMHASGGQKIGVRAIATTGRIGYIFQRDENYELVVRIFFVNPSGEYVDVPWNAVNDVGYSVEACNVDNSLGAFSELEYHAPSGRSEAGKDVCEDESVTWAFRGPQDQIMAVAHALVSAEV